MIVRAAWLGNLVLGVTVAAYAAFLFTVGAAFTVVPETPPGTSGTPSVALMPVSPGLALIAFLCGACLALGALLALRDIPAGFPLAAAAALALTVFGAVLIFGAFGLLFFGGMTALLLIGLIAVVGRLHAGRTDVGAGD
jgi:hypothetical protein